jgi:hypothetical protein
MITSKVRLAFCWFYAACLVLSLETAAYAVADLSDWVGANNAPPDPQAEENNYTLGPGSPPTSAGGTFKARRTRINATIPQSDFEAYLADQTLSGSTTGEDPTRYGFDEDLSMSGTFSFTNPNNADPQFFFGFYNSEPGTINGKQRLGLAVGDETTGVMRIQSQAASGGGTPITNTLTTTGAAPPSAHDPVGHVPAGTYSFDFDYTTADKMFSASISNGTTTWSRTIQLTPEVFVVPDVFDYFGFYQFGSTVAASPPAANSLTFTFNVSNIDYTGDTDAPSVGQDGDHNGDGIVDAADYVAWRKSDIDGPQGYTDFYENFGEGTVGSSPANSGGVPEPSTLFLAMLSLICWSASTHFRTSRCFGT